MRYATHSMMAALILVVGACGIDSTGVQSVEFTLAPHTVFEAPDGLDPIVLTSIASAHGTVTVDVNGDVGMVSVQGLAPLPADFSYTIVLKFAEHERAGIPGGGGGGGGHSHGAISSGSLETEHDDSGFIAYPLGALGDAGDGAWMTNYAAADIADHHMGAVRAAEILLTPPTGPAVDILSGEVQEDLDADADEGAH